MSRLSFFERMERDIDFHKEYLKIENIVLNEPGHGYPSINDEIAKIFRSWKYRRNFMSFNELREHLEFTFERDGYSLNYIPDGQVDSIDRFIVYCEMLINLFDELLKHHCDYDIKVRIQAIIGTIMYDFEKINYVFKKIDNKIIAVQKNAEAIAVADIVDPNLGDAIIEYNHHLLKGDIEAKRTILKKIADALEPKRAELTIANKTVANNFFYMVNNMNVRHNNCDSSDEKKYNSKFATLSAQQKEEWYDDIYQEGLMAFLSLQHLNRNAKIEAFKKV